MQSSGKEGLKVLSLRLSGITPESFVDGPGLRYVIFTQGCLHHCKNCHNPTSWDIKAGKEFTVKEIVRMIKKTNKTFNTVQRSSKIQVITFSGGEPFLQCEGLAQTAIAAHEIGWDVVTYTGYTYEELTELKKTDAGITALLCATDILIDGRYVDEKRTMDLPFRGSSNQRIIDVPRTLKSENLVIDISI